MSIFDSLLGGGVGYYSTEENIKEVDKVIAALKEESDALITSAKTDGTFKPFTVTSGLATAPTTAEGGFSVNLSPDQLALQEQLMGQASNAFSGLGLDGSFDRASEEQKIYDRLQQMRIPEQERNQIALRNQLFGEGRTGLYTDAYGGTPEQLTLSKAMQEGQSLDALNAMQQVDLQRKNQYDLASGLLSSGYEPQQRTLDMLELGRGTAQLPNTLQSNLLTATSNLGSKGLESTTGLEAAKLQSIINNNAAIASLLGGAVSSSGQYSGGLLSDIWGEIKDFF